MSEVKLTEFSVRQLELLLNGVVWQMPEAEISLSDSEKNEDLKLLQVQILNALHFVKQRETTLKN